MKTEKDENEFMTKIEALMETIDSEKDVDADVANLIAAAEMSGGVLPARYRKLAILRHQGLITSDEHNEVIEIDVRAINSGEKTSDEIFKVG